MKEEGAQALRFRIAVCVVHACHNFDTANADTDINSCRDWET